MTKYTVVQHSGTTTGHTEFLRGLESASVTPAEEKKVLDAGGLVFDTYRQAEEYAEGEQYPAGYMGLVPRAPGNFAAFIKVKGLPVYLPKEKP